MKTLPRFLSTFCIVFLLLAPTYSAEQIDEEYSPRSSKCSLFKTALVAVGLLAEPAQTSVAGCYFGVTRIQTLTSITKIAPMYGCDPSRCSRCPAPDQNRFIDTSFTNTLEIFYYCMENTHCQGININRIKLCSDDLRVAYTGTLVWDPKVDPGNTTNPCRECFALNGFYGIRGINETKFENSFQSFLNNKGCP